MPADLREDDASRIRGIRQTLAEAIKVLNGRALSVIRDGMLGLVPLEDVTAELLLLSKDLKRCYLHVLEVAERRDLDYEDTEDLKDLDHHCLWLFRKIHVERLSLHKFDLEAKLRDLISHEAFEIYQALLDADEEERGFLSTDTDRIRDQLLATKT